MPAVGVRLDGGGNPYKVSSYGYYWSSMASNATYGYNLYFGTNVVQSNSNSALTGASVRCVEYVTYSVTVKANNNLRGTVTGSGTHERGSDIAITATPASGYVFKNWTSSTTDITFADANSASTTMRVGAVGTVTANFDYPPANIIYWNGTKMAVGEWSATGTGGPVTQANMLFFKFGSVVGFFNNNDSWAMTRIVFEPSTTKATTYANIPRWNGSTYNDGYISSDAYHTLANVQTGRGDPCKLVGFTLADIAAGHYDNGTLRLPTNAENAAAGYTNVSGGMQTSSGLHTFLPHAGHRSDNGATTYVGSRGGFWSSRSHNATDGYRLYFGSGISNPTYNSDAQFGFGVRCVPQ